MRSQAIDRSILVAMVMVWACGGDKQQAGMAADSTNRDLSLAPAESTSAMNDRPTTPSTQPSRPATPRPSQPTAQPAPPPPPPRPAAIPTVAEGTTLQLTASDTISSRHTKAGAAVTAVSSSAVNGANGYAVIPAGAVFSGTISDIAPAEKPGGKGRLVITFSRVSFGGKNYAVQARTDSLGTVMKGRGVTAGDAAKVGAATAVGAIAGRIIGGNKTGTIIGGAAGAAAGTGVAAATRDVDIVLPAGALVRIVLSAPFELKPLAE